MGCGLIPLNIKLQQDDRTVCCGHKIVFIAHSVHFQLLNYIWKHYWHREPYKTSLWGIANLSAAQLQNRNFAVGSYLKERCKDNTLPKYLWCGVWRFSSKVSCKKGEMSGLGSMNVGLYVLDQLVPHFSFNWMEMIFIYILYCWDTIYRAVYVDPNWIGTTGAT